MLSTREQVPHFLRTQWDQATARSFGPWRVAQAVDPASGQTASAFPQTEATPEDVPVSEAVPELVPAEPEALPEPASAWSDAAIAAIKQEAWEQGLQQGLEQAREEHEAQRHKEGEILRHLGIELRSLQQDPQRFFEPLKRLALHIAEQWVRGELQVSGHAIDQLVRQSLAQLDPAGEKVHVELHPADLERLQSLGEEATADLQLQADPELREGSVRVRLNETVVQDLIEHRIEAMARQLLQQPDAWLPHSTLLHPDKASAMPASAPARPWQRPAPEVLDAQVKESPSEPEEPA